MKKKQEEHLEARAINRIAVIGGGLGVLDLLLDSSSVKVAAIADRIDSLVFQLGKIRDIYTTSDLNSIVKKLDDYDLVLETTEVPEWSEIIEKIPPQKILRAPVTEVVWALIHEREMKKEEDHLVLQINTIVRLMNQLNTIMSPQELESLKTLLQQFTLAWEHSELSRRLDQQVPIGTLFQNYRIIQKQIKSEIKRSVRYGHHLSLIALRVDEFKRFAYLLGSIKAEHLINKIDGLIKANIRKEVDSLYRLDLDKLLLVFPETDKENSVKKAQLLKEMIEDYFAEEELGIPDFEISITPKVVSLPTDALSYDSLIKLIEKEFEAKDKRFRTTKIKKVRGIAIPEFNK